MTLDGLYLEHTDEVSGGQQVLRFKLLESNAGDFHISRFSDTV